MMSRVNHCEHRALQVSAPRASDNIEKTELDRLSVRRNLPLQTRPISGVTIMGSEQTLPLHVEYSDLMVWRTSPRCFSLMQDCGATGCGANGEVDRYVPDCTLPRS